MVLGLDFGGTKVAAAACSLEGTQLAHEVISTRPSDGAEAVLGRGLEMARLVLAQLSSPPLAGVGVATIGVPTAHKIELSPAIPGWEQLALAERVGIALDARVIVANDVKAAATAEARWGALVGADPALYLNLGTGLAAAVVVGGTVVAGAHGAAGEIGYELLSPDDLAIASESRPILEHVVSGMGLAAAGSASAGRQLSAMEVFEAAEDDPALATLIEALVARLAFHLVNLAIALDPERIAVGGGFVRSWDRLEGPLGQALAAAVPFPPALVRARRPFDASLIGALCLGIEAAGVSPAGELMGGDAAPSGVASDGASSSGRGVEV